MTDRRTSGKPARHPLLVPVAVYTATFLTIGLLGTFLAWRLGGPGWLWAWSGLIAYLVIAAVASARHQPRTNPWVDYRGGLSTPPLKVRYRLAERWDKEHRPPSQTPRN